MEWGGGCLGRWGCECIFITSPRRGGDGCGGSTSPLTDDDNTSSSGPVVLSCDVFESNNIEVNTSRNLFLDARMMSRTVSGIN